MSVKLPRTAKLPPDPGDIAYLKKCRDMLEALTDIGMEFARQAGAEVRALARPKPARSAGQRPPAAPALTAAVPVFNQLVRTIQACMDMHQKLGVAIATAHTTAEFAGLLHPHRQAILDYLHDAIRVETPRPFRRTTHNDIEIRVSEELGYAPDRNPGDVIAEMCLQYHLPDNPEAYPNNWRPTPKPDELKAA